MPNFIEIGGGSRKFSKKLVDLTRNDPHRHLVFFIVGLLGPLFHRAYIHTMFPILYLLRGDDNVRIGYFTLDCNLDALKKKVE